MSWIFVRLLVLNSVTRNVEMSLTQMTVTPARLRVHFLPQFVAEAEMAGSTVVVVDLLRASTTICQALASGAREIIPFVEVELAAQAASDYGREEVLLGGERGGARIEGFDLGNSPVEYTSEAVFNRTILFTTTNGTRALDHARKADQVVLGAMVNLSAVVAFLQQVSQVDILCAGTRGQVTREDILAAGAIVHNLLALKGGRWELSEEAKQAQVAWGGVLNAARVASRSPSSQLAIELQETPGGRNLIAIGQDDDLAECAQIDRFEIVPRFDPVASRIFVP